MTSFPAFLQVSTIAAYGKKNGVCVDQSRNALFAEIVFPFAFLRIPGKRLVFCLINVYNNRINGVI